MTDLFSTAPRQPLAEALATARPGEAIAGYRLLRPLGQGGMASVWLAERAEGGLRREVAIKLPLSASPALAERFARERDVLAALDHPHIARLIDAGEDAGRPYLVLEAIAGEPLLTHAEHRQLDTRERVALLLQVLDALAHAHTHMVVHRDLKPANILVDTAGQVKLLDFGIAKLLAPDAAALTQDAAALLTPRYAAPEQVLGRPVSTATDVYAAGAVLHELVTGRPPHEADDGLALMRAIVHEPPRAPGLGADLDTILLKALATEPTHRYASAERMAEDLQRWLAHRPILARRVPAWQRLALLLRRQPRASAAVALTLALLAGVATVAGLQARESAAQRARGDAVRDFVFRMLADAEPQQGRSEVSAAEMVDAATENARRDVADPRLRGELLAALGRVNDRLNRPAPAQALLIEATALLASHAQPGDAVLNLARADLARSLLNEQSSRATALAREALADCTATDCARARAQAHFVLAADASWQGLDAAALAESEASARDTEAAYGPASTELAVSLDSIATAALNLGRLPEAAKALARARGIAEHRVMRAAQRARLDLVEAALQAATGQLDAARSRLRPLLDAPASWYERAAQWRTLAQVEVLRGDAKAAMAAAAAARDVLPASWQGRAQGWLARAAWGQAASLAGRHEEALAALREAVAGLADNDLAAASIRRQTVQRQLAEALLRSGSAGHTREALGRLQALQVEANPLEAALRLDALACARARLGDPGAAAQLRESGARWAGLLPPEHPWRRRHDQVVAGLPGCAVWQ